MAYEPYADVDYYQSIYQGGAFQDPDEARRYLVQASRHIDSLTYNRIISQGISGLTERAPSAMAAARVPTVTKASTPVPAA